MFQEHCFAMWPSGEKFCSASKLQMLDKQCLIVLTGLKMLNSNLAEFLVKFENQPQDT